MRRRGKDVQGRLRGAGYKRGTSRVVFQVRNLQNRIKLARARDQMAVMTMAMETAELAIIGLLGDSGDKGQAEAALINMKESMTYDGVQDVLNRVRFAAVRQAVRNVVLTASHEPDSEFGKGFDSAIDKYDAELDEIADLMWKGKI